MKRILLLSLFLFSFAITSFAQKENYFSLSANFITKTKFTNTIKNCEVSLLPSYTINRFKISLGLSYSYNSSYDIYSDKWGFSNKYNKYFVSCLNLPLSLHFTFYRNTRISWDCFASLIFTNLYSAYMNDYYHELRYGTNKWHLSKTIFSERLGVNLSIMALDNLRFNLSSFIHITNNGPLKAISKKETNIDYYNEDGLSLGLSFGVEYLFR
ncbi:MAG: hypothetical protein LBM25_06025 [Bacteroidales bacterium]|jgi:hypothetical protein|nr:hypothetical protein [Bacteroidales bacterium]